MKPDTGNSNGTEDHLSAHDKFLHKTLDNMLEGVQIIGFDWKYIYVNEAMARHGKYDRDEYIGRTVMEKYPGIEHTDVYKVYCRCFEERVPVHMENRFVFPDNSVGWFELSFQPVPEGIFILSIDITERKKDEERLRELNEQLERRVVERTALLERHIRQLRESEEKFQKAFQASAAGIAITRTSDGTYVNVNNAFTQMTGYSAEELIGHSSVDLGLVADVKKREEVLQLVRDTGAARSFEMAIRNRSGKILDILSSVETIFVNDEKLAINIIYDITERKQAEEQMAAMNKELEAFSFTVSHDLRAPLRIIDGYVQLLGTDLKLPADSNAGQLLARIQFNTKKMSKLIDDLLAFSRLGKQAVNKTEINVSELVKTVVAELSETGKDKAGIKVGALHAAYGDYGLMKQVFINLIGNAVKYSSKKAEPVVEVSSQENDREVIYSVKDNGEGFDMLYADKLFGVFQRLHSQKDFEGTGVGLAIVHRIITKHGGKIWAEAAPGVGVTFSFSLPRR